MKKLLARADAFLDSPVGKKLERYAIRVAVTYLCAKAGIAVDGVLAG